MTLAVSIIVPVFNEVNTISPLLQLLADLPLPDKEIIVIDDGSRDGTREVIESWQDRPGFTILLHSINQGKGTAVRSGLAVARGQVAIVQDADLEYDPGDIARLIEPILRGEATVVFGSRYLHPTPRPWTKFRHAVSLLNGLSRILYGQHLSDQATCYKAMPLALWKDLQLTSNRFELCAEITAKLGRRGIPIVELPISYRPRSKAQGKKIGWRDALMAVYTLLILRVSTFKV